MVTGPFAVGAAMDMAGSSALPWSLVATYIVVIGFTALRWRRNIMTAPCEMAATLTDWRHHESN